MTSERTPPAPIYFSVQRIIQVQLGLEKALGAFLEQIGVSAEGPALCGKNQTVTIVNRKSGNSHWGAYITGMGSSSSSLLPFA